MKEEGPLDDFREQKPWWRWRWLAPYLSDLSVMKDFAYLNAIAGAAWYPSISNMRFINPAEGGIFDYFILFMIHCCIEVLVVFVTMGFFFVLLSVVGLRGRYYYEEVVLGIVLSLVMILDLNIEY